MICICICICMSICTLYNSFIHTISPPFINPDSKWMGSWGPWFFCGIFILLHLYLHSYLCVNLYFFITALFIQFPHLLLILTASGWGARAHDLFSYLGNIFHCLKILFHLRNYSKLFEKGRADISSTLLYCSKFYSRRS